MLNLGFFLRFFENRAPDLQILEVSNRRHPRVGGGSDPVAGRHEGATPFRIHPTTPSPSPDAISYPVTPAIFSRSSPFYVRDS